MASISWTEPSAFTRAKLDDGAAPPAWWVKPAFFLGITAFMMAFPLARGRPMNGSWEFTVLVSVGVAFLLVVALPFIVTRSGDQWQLNDSGIGMSGWRVPWLMVAGHCEWKDVLGYRLSEQEFGGVGYEVLEVHLAGGVPLKAALSGRATRKAVEAFLSERGVQVLESPK